MAEGVADVVQFPVKKRCFDCERALVASWGVFCGVYQQPIRNEKVAEECEAYCPPQSGPVVIINGRGNR